MVSNIQELSAKGLNEMEIAKSLGIGYSTFRRHRKSNEQIQTAINKGREEGVQNNGVLVERTLGKRTSGYWVNEEITETTVGPQGTTVKKRVHKKYIPPSDVAIFFWLCNRFPDRWKSIQKAVAVERKQETDTELDVSKFTTKELKTFMGLMRKAEGKDA